MRKYYYLFIRLLKFKRRNKYYWRDDKVHFFKSGGKWKYHPCTWVRGSGPRCYDEFGTEIAFAKEREENKAAGEFCKRLNAK